MNVEINNLKVEAVRPYGTTEWTGEATLNLFGETRTVPVRGYDLAHCHDFKFYTGYIFGAKVGRAGSKVWPTHMVIFVKADGTAVPSLRTVHLNKQAMIVGWMDRFNVAMDSQHNSAARRAK